MTTIDSPCWARDYATGIDAELDIPCICNLPTGHDGFHVCRDGCGYEWGDSALDPEPYRCDEKPGLRHDRETVYLCHDPIFDPRPEYEQDATAYLPRSSDALPGGES